MPKQIATPKKTIKSWRTVKNDNKTGTNMIKM